MPVQLKKQNNECDGTFPLLEELLRDMEDQQPYLFIELDWTSLSSIKYWSYDFIREFFEYFNTSVLLTCQSFTEEFLVEIMQVLIPKSKNQIDINSVIKTIHCICKPSLEFKRQFPLNTTGPKGSKGTKSVKTKKNYKINQSFENIINYIQDTDPKEYSRLDLKSISSFKLLSENFVTRHFEKLDKNILFCHQKFSNSYITLINEYNGIPFNAMFVSHIRQLNLQFIFELNKTFLKNYKSQIVDKIVNKTLSLLENNESYFFRNKTGINDDMTISISQRNTKTITSSLDTFFLDGQ
jgi:hypothetical protein